MFTTLLFILCFPPTETPITFAPSYTRTAYVLTLPDYIDDSRELFDSMQNEGNERGYTEEELSYIVNSCITF